MRAKDQFLISNTKTGKVGRHHLMFRNVTAIKRQRGGKWLIKNHNAEHMIDLDKVANITLLGLPKEMNLPVQFLQELNQEHVALILSDLSSDKIQVLEPHHHGGINHVTGLHEIRRSEKKSSHVARELILAQAHNRHQQIAPDLLKKLKSAQTPSIVRVIEAELANQYWAQFYRRLRHPELIRREWHPINDALNATSHQLAQVVSRHLINHRLPLEYGVLHQSGCALVYDIMEPFRAYAEEAVVNALSDTHLHPSELVQASCGSFTKVLEDYYTYRQGTEKKSLQQLIEITVMNLVHYGRSQYNQDNSSRFWVPTIGKRKFAR